MYELLKSLLASSALETFQRKRKREMTFAEAARFWGLNESYRGDAIDTRVNHVGAVLRDAEASVGVATIRLSNGRHVSADDVAELIELHNYLLERFARHLNLLRRHTDKGLALQKTILSDDVQQQIRRLERERQRWKRIAIVFVAVAALAVITCALAYFG